MGSTRESQHASIDHLVKLIREYSTGMLCTRTRDGQLRSRPMAIACVEDNGDVWFASSIDTPKCLEIQTDPHVNVMFMQTNQYLSLAGHAELIQDRRKIDQLWHERWGAYFPQGKNTPDLCLIKVRGEHGEFWDYTGVMPKLQFLFEAGKAYVQGKRAEMSHIGASEKVEIK